jgi:hypothetical protein
VRVPFPVHIPLAGATGFAVLLLAVQLFQGTSFLFALCCFLFIIIATLAFNLAGGFSRPSGAYVFFYSLLAVIFGLVSKAVLGEPADSNLLAPQLTIEVFLGGITAMLAAVYISRKLTRRQGLLQNLIPESKMQNAIAGCMVTGLIVSAIFTFVPKENGSFLSALAQVNRFLPMAMILGVVHEIRKSGGTRSISVPVLISAIVIFASGLIGYSKEGIFTPLLCWFVAAGSQGFKPAFHKVIAGSALVLFMIIFLVPYAQLGRHSERSSWDLLMNLGQVRSEYKAHEEESYADQGPGYFNSPQGFMDRLQMISVDDGLIELTERHGPFGLTPIVANFENLVPRVFWPNKPTINFGNLYAHEIGGLADDDVSTGISFTPSGEAYHLARWFGVFLVAPALWIILFVLFDSLCGDTRLSPWGLLMTALFGHMAPEGMLGGVIYTLGFGTFGVLIAALSAAYVMPIVGTLFKGPEKTQMIRNRLLPARQRQPLTGDSSQAG